MTPEKQNKEYEKARDAKELSYAMEKNLSYTKKMYGMADFGREYTLKQMEGEMKKFAEWLNSTDWNYFPSDNIWINRDDEEKTFEQIYDLFITSKTS